MSQRLVLSLACVIWPLVLINLNFDIGVMIDRLWPYPLTMAILQPIWKSAAAFKHVRTVRLGRFLAQTFENYLPFIFPRLNGIRRPVVVENGPISGGRRSRRAIEVASLVSFSYFWRGRQRLARNKRTQNPIKLQNNTRKTKGKKTLFIWLIVHRSYGSKHAKSSILWSISRDHLNQSEVTLHKLQKMYEIK